MRIAKTRVPMELVRHAKATLSPNESKVTMSVIGDPAASAVFSVTNHSAIVMWLWSNMIAGIGIGAYLTVGFANTEHVLRRQAKIVKMLGHVWRRYSAFIKLESWKPRSTTPMAP